MKIHDVAQGTPEWLALRAGMPTSSCFSKILTAKTRKPSKSSYPYMCQLVAESVIGPLDGADTPWMQRGSEMEDEARKWYAFQRGVTPVRVGFVTNEDESVGCSPDSLIGTCGGLEIKCPGAAKHVEYLLDGPTVFGCQVQGCMWLTTRQWWDVVSYCPGFPTALVRIERDDEFIADLETATLKFVDDLIEAKTKLADMMTDTGKDADAVADNEK